MADIFTKEKRSRVMSNIRADNTKPELSLKDALKGLRLRYQPKMFGKPDFASKKYKLVVFVDGCFWHGCPTCKGKKPKTNKKFWSTKIDRNKERDKEIDLHYKSRDWIILRFWEHEITGSLNECVAKIKGVLSQ
jgi:DNA mismatch endonuclease, patch repair protein